MSNDEVIIQEKLDGSCVCAYRQKDKIIALGREGDLASLSPNESRRLWSDWVELNHDRFLAILLPGERLVGEWLAMAHGTRYRLIHEPFVAFDLFTVNNRALGVDELVSRVSKQNIVTPKTVYRGPPCSLSNAVALLESHHGAIDPCEGLIWRLERNSTPLFRAKYVASEKIDGCFLPEKTGEKAVWNWHPNKFV